MEFRYSIKATIYYSISAFFGIVLLLGAFYGIYNHTLKGAVEGVIISLVVVLVYFRGVIFQLRNRGATITVDETGISLKKGKYHDYTKWEDVNSVKITFISSGLQEKLGKLPFDWRLSFVIRIKGDTSNIDFGSNINGARELIMYTKSKLGDKFDTTELPLEYKFKQI